MKRRSSSCMSTVLDHREPSSTAPTTPVLSNSPLTLPANANQLLKALVYRLPLAPRSHTPVNIENGVEYQTPLHNRGVIIEDEDKLPEQLPPLPTGLPQILESVYRSSCHSRRTFFGWMCSQQVLLQPHLKRRLISRMRMMPSPQVCHVPLPTNEQELS